MNSRSEKMIAVIRGMLLAQIAPEKIYAFVQTGRIVTELNENDLPPAIIREWKAAIDDYHAKTNAIAQSQQSLQEFIAHKSK